MLFSIFGNLMTLTNQPSNTINDPTPNYITISPHFSAQD